MVRLTDTDNPYHSHVLSAYTNQTTEQVFWDADFYGRAYEYAQYLAAKYKAPTLYVCDLIAVLSPMKSWPENVKLARDALALVQGFAWVDWSDLDDLKVTRQRRHAAVKALNGEGVTGPKVSCFAANIKGDLTQVTVDRHMLTAAGKDPNNSTKHARALCQWYVNDVAQSHKHNPHGFWPAEVQAIIWAEERRRKGHK